MEFKRLSDVEVIAEPTESANVLIEENGVIKKAPKTAVGGAGNEPDMVIEVATTINNVITADNMSIKSGSVEAVCAAFNEDRLPIVKVEYVFDDKDTSWRTAQRNCYSPDVEWYGEWLLLRYLGNANNTETTYRVTLGLNMDSSFNNCVIKTISFV